MGLIAEKDFKVGSFYTLDLPAFRKLPCVTRVGYSNVQAAFPTAMVRVEKYAYAWNGQSDKLLQFVENDPSKYGPAATFTVPKGVAIEAVEVLNPPFSAFFASLNHGVMTSGCDPEIFVVDGRNRMIPAFEFLPNKDEAKYHDCRVNPGSNDHLTYLTKTED